MPKRLTRKKQPIPIGQRSRFAVRGSRFGVWSLEFGVRTGGLISVSELFMAVGRLQLLRAALCPPREPFLPSLFIRKAILDGLIRAGFEIRKKHHAEAANLEYRIQNTEIRRT